MRYRPDPFVSQWIGKIESKYYACLAVSPFIVNCEPIRGKNYQAVRPMIKTSRKTNIKINFTEYMFKFGSYEAGQTRCDRTKKMCPH